MNISDLDERFTIAEYEPDKSNRATVRLVNGAVEIAIPYQFHSEDGSVSPTILVVGEATAQQLTDLKTILAAVLLATNAAIEATHGWTKYTGE